MQKKIIVLLIGIALNISALAQVHEIANLKIGDTIPNLRLRYSLNGKQQTISTNELRGKFIILDFWNIWCSVCIQAMPEMAQLQRQFSKDFQIFTVTNNSHQQINDQFRKIAERTKSTEAKPGLPPDLAAVVSDTLLHKLFPHRSVPHHIWIDRTGKVIHIAAGYDATAQNMTDVMQGKTVVLSEKMDTGIFNFKVPLFMEGNGRQLKNLKYYSMLYKEAREYQNVKIIRDSDVVNQTAKFTYYNLSPLELFREATIDRYNRTFFSPARTRIEIKDSVRFYWPKDPGKMGAWRAENLYCYELQIPLSKKNQTGALMFKDLNTYLPFQAKIETRPTKCLTLVRVKNDDISLKVKQKQEIKKEDVKEGQFLMETGNVKRLISLGLSSLQTQSKMPIIDETEYLGELSIFLSSRTDLKTIRSELKRYGLDLLEKTLEIDLLIITDQ